MTFIQADHSTVGGNQRLGRQVRAGFTRLDVLINNVGGLHEHRRETADAYEATLAMNFVGPFALTAELVPLLRANAPSRCVIVTSAAFKMCKDDPFADVQSTAEAFVWPRGLPNGCASACRATGNRRHDLAEATAGRRRFWAG